METQPDLLQAALIHAGIFLVLCVLIFIVEDINHWYEKKKR
jgi:hypothetical protein